MATPRVITAFAAASIAALFITGCDSGEPARTGTYKADPESGTITASAPVDDGDVTMQSGPAIAAPLPVDLPIMAGAEITEATHVASPTGLRIALVEMVSDESPAAVAAFYRAAADEAGLGSAFDMGSEQAVTYIAIGEGRERMTLHAARGRVAPDGSRAPALDEDGEPVAREGDGASAVRYRDATIIQLHIVGRVEETVSTPAS